MAISIRVATAVLLTLPLAACYSGKVDFKPTPVDSALSRVELPDGKALTSEKMELSDLYVGQDRHPWVKDASGAVYVAGVDESGQPTIEKYSSPGVKEPSFQMALHTWLNEKMSAEDVSKRRIVGLMARGEALTVLVEYSTEPYELLNVEITSPKKVLEFWTLPTNLRETSAEFASITTTTLAHDLGIEKSDLSTSRVLPDYRGERFTLVFDQLKGRGNGIRLVRFYIDGQVDTNFGWRGSIELNPDFCGIVFGPRRNFRLAQVTLGPKEDVWLTGSTDCGDGPTDPFVIHYNATGKKLEKYVMKDTYRDYMWLGSAVDSESRLVGVLRSLSSPQARLTSMRVTPELKLDLNYTHDQEALNKLESVAPVRVQAVKFLPDDHMVWLVRQTLLRGDDYQTDSMILRFNVDGKKEESANRKFMTRFTTRDVPAVDPDKAEVQEEVLVHNSTLILQGAVNEGVKSHLSLYWLPF